MNIFDKKIDCCGCSACMSICPKDAVSMKPDEEGFLYPVVEDSLCISCGLCKSVCAFQNGYDTQNNFSLPYGYAVKHKNEEVRENSRSGGMFTALTDYILEHDGIVFGAGFGEHFTVIHKAATTKEERNEFRGSKYVQSDMGDTLSQVKKYLKEGRYVLFSGTACQTAAVKRFLKKDYEKLYLVDIVCHGTPSPLIWEDFLTLKEKELHGNITLADFRNKRKFGWKAHYESVTVKGKEHSSRLYTKLFYLNAILRPSCYHCKYTNMNRPSDITLADFWGHEKAVPGFHEDDKGVSLILANTDKGKHLFDLTCKDVTYIDCTGYKYRHTNMKKPSEEPENRAEFWQDYKEHGFRYVAEKYTKYRYESYPKRVIKRILNKLDVFHIVRNSWKLVKKVRGKLHMS